MADATPSVPVEQSSGSIINRIDNFLDKYILPYPVKYLTNRITIILTLCFVIPLIVFANVTEFELAANSYLNVMSVVVSSTVLLYSTLAIARDRAASERREQIAAAHQKILEERAQADHKKIEEIHQHLNDLSAEVTQHVTISLESIHKLLVNHLVQLQSEDHAYIETMNKTVIEGIAAHHQELAKLNELLQASRTKKGNTRSAS
jgi:hypothetical protein